MQFSVDNMAVGDISAEPSKFNVITQVQQKVSIVKPTPTPKGGAPASDNLSYHDLYVSGIVARTTRFGTMTYHDQTKDFWG